MAEISDTVRASYSSDMLKIENQILLSRKKAAEFLGVKPNTLAVWSCTRRYALPIVRIGRLCKYRLSDLMAFMTPENGGARE